MDELFDIPVSLSPRLQWMRQNEVRTHHAPHCAEAPWCAWTPDNDAYSDIADSVPNDPSLCGYGKTEAEAVESLADKMGVVNWSNSA